MKLKENKKVVFDELTHSYFCGETELIGVTSLMKAMGLSPDYSGINPHTLAHAAARGTAVHRTLEDYDNGNTVIQPITVDDNEGGIVTFDTSRELAAYRLLNLNVAASEYLVSDNKVVASMIDKVLATEDENVVDLGDIKTTSTLHIDALEWQLSIYAYLFELQNKGKTVRDLYGIHVRDGQAKAVKVKRIAAEEIKKLIDCYKKGKSYTPAAAPDLSLIVPADEIPVLVQDEAQIATLELKLKEVQARIKERKDRIYEYMLDNGIKELVCAGGKYTLKSPSTRTNFNAKQLKEDNPDLYAKYATTAEVKGSITFKFDQQ